MSGRSCRPISSTSSKPSVVTSVTRAPFRSSSAFVATVEPCRTRVPRPAPARASPASTACAGSCGVDGTLNATRSPPRQATTSVKVPPVSMPMALAAGSTLATPGPPARGCRRMGFDRVRVLVACFAPTLPPALEQEHERDDDDEREQHPGWDGELVAEPGEEPEIRDPAEEHGEE